MSQEADHIELANRNHSTLFYLMKEAENHPEWVATVAFYKAVHVIEAVFAADGRGHSNGHDRRIDCLKVPRYAEIFKHFRRLYSASLVARYLEDSSPKKLDGKASESYERFTSYMPADRVVPNLVEKRLNAIEQLAVGFLSPESKKSLLRVCREPAAAK